MKRTYIYIIMCSLLATSLHAQEGFGTYLRNIIQKQEKGILVTAKLIEACGLCDSLDVLMDNEYERLYQKGEIMKSFYMPNYGFATSEPNNAYAPMHRKYGYTLFAETDDLWEQLIGKNYKTISVADVKNYVSNKGLYPNSLNNNQYDDENNMLNQFVTYHLLPHRLPSHKLVNHINENGYRLSNPDSLTIPVTEYYVTMGKRRLLRTYESAESNGIYINRFPKEDKARQGTGHEISCDPDKLGIYIDTVKNIPCSPNAIVYPISNILAYSEDVINQMGNIRLRFDIVGLFPEFSNNDIRLKRAYDEASKFVSIPNSRLYSYLDDLTMSQETVVVYLNAWNNEWCNMYHDEIKAVGRYDLILRLPPVPKSGEYELRYKVLTNGNRGTAQVYFGTDRENLLPIGMPIDFTKGFNNTQFAQQHGWVDDSGDDYFDQMVDNEMHYHGIMKGTMSFGSNNVPERRNTFKYNTSIRYVLVRQIMEPDQTYYLRLKSVLDNDKKEVYMDYIELCPKSVYDNPDEPEDIW